MRPLRASSMMSSICGDVVVIDGDVHAFDEPRDIARQQVDFEIDLVARLQPAERRDLRRVRNDVDAEARAIDLVHRQRDAVERDRALGRDEARQRHRHLERDAHGLAFRRHRDDLAHAVDMAGDEMAAQLVAELSGRSRLTGSPAFQPPSVVLDKRLARRLDREPAVLAVPLSTTVRQTPEQAIEAPIVDARQVVAGAR